MRPKQLPLFEDVVERALAPQRVVVIERLRLPARARPPRLGARALEVLLALPGRADRLAEKLGRSQVSIFGALSALSVRGLALRLKGSGASGIWARP